jgi:CHAT domain-containing protein
MNRELTPAGLVQQVLVPPRLWDRVRKAEEVVIVPDGVLHLLPFEALIVSNDSRGARYWLDEGPVVRYGHSLTSLVEEALAPERAATSGSILSLSDPDFGDEGHSLPRLPGTARESEAIARLFPSRTIVLKGEAASEEGLRRHLEGVRYLHMATHGLADMNHGEMASLALTPSGSDASDRDGFLNLFEIYDLRLDCELAVLSACDTRIGPRLEGEGVFALSRGFQSAGARRTVASLWQAADESTALLIESFFQGIADAERAGKRIEYSRLLRDAKRRVRARPEWSSPFYWAPLVLTGKG